MVFLDDDPKLHGKKLLGYPVLGPIKAHTELNADGWIVGIGENLRRQEIVEELSGNDNIKWQTLLHLNCVVSESTKMGVGSVVVGGAVVNACAKIGNHTIINTSATVGHDCVIGDYCLIAPGVNIGGGVIIGDNVLVGIGASIINSTKDKPIKIGSNAIVGAGASVTESVATGITVVGVPARKLDRK